MESIQGCSLMIFNGCLKSVCKRPAAQLVRRMGVVPGDLGSISSCIGVGRDFHLFLTTSPVCVLETGVGLLK